ncbi:MAG: hypothetical protein LBP59_16080 [Planctomycetaceae bacterium]|jgi:hypothetical protein|nr:hypothetical protein [Planctomycetaceae bacterium]
MQKKSHANIDKQTATSQLSTISKKILSEKLSLCIGLIRLIFTGIYGILNCSAVKFLLQIPVYLISRRHSIYCFALLFFAVKTSRLNKRSNFICSHSIILFTAFCLISAVIFSGCSHTGVNRGHIISLEYNRPPWIGCPPDTGCDTERTCKLGHNKSSCDCDDNSTPNSNAHGKKIRRHCGLSANCTAQNPCCEVPGCGMWIDPSDPNSIALNQRAPRACGLTPFCSPMRPCGMTPNCGRPANPYAINQLAFSPVPPVAPFGFNNPYAGLNGVLINGLTLPSLNLTSSPTTNLPATISPSITPTITPNSPTPIPTPNSPQPNQNINNNAPTQKNNQQTPPKPATIAGPNGILVSMGIVPGVSAINGGGYVAASGVITPHGIMTPNGIQLPNGTINPQMVIRTCGMHAGCTPGRPCGMSPNCGVAIPVGLVSNNAAPLAAELIARNNRNNNIIPATNNIYGNLNGYNNYNNVMQVNGTSPQNLQNLQNYANYQSPQNYQNRRGTNYQTNYPTNYAANYNNYNNQNPAIRQTIANNNAGLRTPPPLQPELYNNDQSDNEFTDDNENNENENDNENDNDNLANKTNAANKNKKSNMPLPRFHSVPTEPAFNRRSGIPVQKTPNANANNKISQNQIDRKNINGGDPASAIERAYLEGIVTALNEVEAEIDAQNNEIENAKIKKIAIEKAANLQAKLDAKNKLDEELKQLEELEIQNEIIKLEQQRNKKIIAKRNAELVEEQTQILTQKQNQLQQEQINAKIKTNNQNIQPANYQNTTKNNDNIFANAINYIKGDTKKQNQNNAKIIAKNNPQQKLNNNKNKTQNKKQKNTISQLIAPVTNLIGTNNTKNTNTKNIQTTQKTKNINNELTTNQILPTKPPTFPKPKYNIISQDDE